MEVPFYIPGDPEDKEEEEAADAEHANSKMDETQDEEAPKDAEAVVKSRAATQEAWIKNRLDTGGADMMSMRRTSLLNKAHTMVGRQWTTMELLKSLRFRPQATPSDDEGEIAPFALLEKTWVPGADTGGTWVWIDQQGPIA